MSTRWKGMCMYRYGRENCISFDEAFEELSGDCITLNEYCTDTRYPDTLRFGVAFTREEAGYAVTCAEIVLDFIRPRTQELLDGETD
jgi:HEPN domain-containing protein